MTSHLSKLTAATMERIMIKKKPKWDSLECEILVETVSSYNNLDSKFSNCYTSADRGRFWRETTEKINAVGGNDRTIQQVEKKWRDLKSQTKSKEVKRREEMRKTGGGLAEVPSLSTMEQKILGKIPTCNVEGILGGKDTSSTSTSETLTDDSESTSQQPQSEELDESIQSSTDTESLVLTTSTEKENTCNIVAEEIERQSTSERGSKKRPRDSISDFVISMEGRKLDELKNITETLKSIDNSLKELVNLKKQRLGNDVDFLSLEL